MSSTAGEFITETLEYDGGRQVTAYVPAAAAEAVVFAGDGQLITSWGEVLKAADLPPTMIIGAHRVEDETLRLHEYSSGRSTAAFAFDPQRFAAHEKFFVEDVRRWAATRLAVRLPAGRTAVFGVSAGAELALAMGLRHPDIYGAVFCASPGAGYRPPAALPGRLPSRHLESALPIGAVPLAVGIPQMDSVLADGGNGPRAVEEHIDERLGDHAMSSRRRKRHPAMIAASTLPIESSANPMPARRVGLTSQPRRPKYG